MDDSLLISIRSLVVKTVTEKAKIDEKNDALKQINELIEKFAEQLEKCSEDAVTKNLFLVYSFISFCYFFSFSSFYHFNF